MPGSSNLNKIVPKNIKFRPWTFAKNTSEIVNNCIQTIYKNTHCNFKNELMPTKMAAVRQENKGPIRSWKSQERITQLSIAKTLQKHAMSHHHHHHHHHHRAPSHLPRDQQSGSTDTSEIPPKQGAVAHVSLNKKFLKAPALRIYGNRRYGSSASSAKHVLWVSHEDRHKRHPTTSAQANYLMRSYVTQPLASLNMNTGVCKYLEPARNQHIESHLGSVPYAIKLSTAIQRDLMPLDAVREHISLSRNRAHKYAARKQTADPMEGWHHPPPHDLLMADHHRHLNKRREDNGDFLETYNRLKIATKNRHTENLQKLEKTTQLLGPMGKKNVARQRISDSYASTAREASRIDQATYSYRIDQTKRQALGKTVVGNGIVPTAASVVVNSFAPRTPSIKSRKTSKVKASQLQKQVAKVEPKEQPQPQQVEQPQMQQQMKNMSTQSTQKPTAASSPTKLNKGGNTLQSRGEEAKTKSAEKTKLKSDTTEKTADSRKNVNSTPSQSDSYKRKQAQAKAYGHGKMHAGPAKKQVKTQSKIQDTAAATMAGTGNGTSLNVNSSSRFNRSSYYHKKY